MRNLLGVVPIPTRGVCPVGQHKFRYRSRRLALQAVALNRKTGGHARSAYRCSVCHDWHVTSLEAPPCPA